MAEPIFFKTPIDLKDVKKIYHHYPGFMSADVLPPAPKANAGKFVSVGKPYDNLYPVEKNIWTYGYDGFTLHVQEAPSFRCRHAYTTNQPIFYGNEKISYITAAKWDLPNTYRYAIASYDNTRFRLTGRFTEAIPKPVEGILYGNKVFFSKAEVAAYAAGPFIKQEENEITLYVDYVGTDNRVIVSNGGYEITHMYMPGDIVNKFM